MMWILTPDFTFLKSSHKQPVEPVDVVSVDFFFHT